MNVQELKDEIKQQVKAVIILALAALCFSALSFTKNTGEVGTFFNNTLTMIAGDLAFLLPLVLVTLALQMALPWKIPNIRQRLAGIILFSMILLVWAHMRLLTTQEEMLMSLGFYRTSFQLGAQQQGGGITGALLSVMLYFLFRDIGSYIVLGAATIISFLLITNYSLTRLGRDIVQCLCFLGRAIARTVKSVLSFFSVLFVTYPDEMESEEDDDVDVVQKFEPESEVYVVPLARSAKQAEESGTQPRPATLFDFHETEKNTVPASVSPPGKPVAKVDCLPDGDVGSQLSISVMPISQSDYVLPPLSLLSRVPRLKDSQQQKNIAERAKILERTLESFGVRVKVVDAQTGPTVTRFELQPESGVKVSKIVALADDLALNLAASDVRIEAPIPGKAAVGIEVPNKVIAPVYLRDVLEHEHFKRASSPLTIALGKDITGNPVAADLMKMPHLLIAGSTGSGKSVCINTLTASILFYARPEEVKFVMIDPKVVELSTFNGIPHLLMPVITEAKKASLALKNMVKEMSRRYELFAGESVRDIRGYNDKKNSINVEEELLPYIVVIIDELADLMMVAAADVEDSIARLAQMSRAAGIHLIIATQRPSVDVITGIIKANITSRIAFAVSSQVDSRTILDIGGAEKLLGRGDMLFHPSGVSKPFRVQGAFINERELSALLEHIKSQGEPQYQQQLMAEDEDEDEWYEEDELFPEALMLVAEAGTASISLLQRRLRIGYTRAARLIDDMERRSFVGRFEGSKAREVFISGEQASRLLLDHKDTQAEK
jgi:S-DNA-T family DNA segregation ATPase FtsK/SpoIIIE